MYVELILNTSVREIEQCDIMSRAHNMKVDNERRNVVGLAGGPMSQMQL